MLILFDDATRDMISNKTFEAIVIKLSIRGRTFEKKYQAKRNTLFYYKDFL